MRKQFPRVVINSSGFIEKMQEKDKDLAEPLATPAENASAGHDCPC